MSDRIPIPRLPMRTLATHVQRLLTPCNIFVVPIPYSGPGEVSDFLGISGGRERGRLRHATALHTAR
jgi:hypothetical protein